jgi:nonsense-mediated mRNA decay protein 3
MRRFCYKCGKQTERLIDGLCEECIEQEMIKKVVSIEYWICPRCGRIREGKVWKIKSLEDVLKKRLKATRIDMEKGLAETVSGKIRFSLEIRKVTCIHCSRIAGGYYESVLQLRGFSNDEITKITQMIKEEFFTKTSKHGHDFYFLKKSSAEKVARRIKKTFKNVEIKKSYKLVTKKDGVDVYRNYVSVRKK